MVVRGVAREATEGVDNHGLQAAFVPLAERNKREKLGSLGGLGGLAPLDEHTRDVEPFPLAVLATDALLRRQAQVLRLFRRRDAAVDDGSHGPRRSAARASPSARRSARLRDSLASNSKIAARSSKHSRRSGGSFAATASNGASAPRRYPRRTTSAKVPSCARSASTSQSARCVDDRPRMARASARDSTP
jgi:hypothetical protein